MNFWHVIIWTGLIFFTLKALIAYIKLKFSPQLTSTEIDAYQLRIMNNLSAIFVLLHLLFTNEIIDAIRKEIGE